MIFHQCVWNHYEGWPIAMPAWLWSHQLLEIKQVRCKGTRGMQEWSKRPKHSRKGGNSRKGIASFPCGLTALDWVTQLCSWGKAIFMKNIKLPYGQSLVSEDTRLSFKKHASWSWLITKDFILVEVSELCRKQDLPSLLCHESCLSRKCLSFFSHKGICNWFVGDHLAECSAQYNKNEG